MASVPATMTRCGCRLLIALIALSTGLASTASAVTIVLKKDGKTIRAKLIREYASGVVVDEVKLDGQVVRRDIPLADIELMLDPIEVDRLATLDPEKPQSYRIYAEELAEKKADPDAREMAIRLYLIAAHLDREKLGKSSLLGMTALARTPSERRRFQAMVYLLDPKHDRRALDSARPRSVSTEPSEPTDASTARVIQAMQFLRQGRIKEAKNLARREGFKDVLAKHPEILTFAEFEEAATPRCPQCEFGKEKCPQCKGKGRLAGGNVCMTCYGRKNINCRRCDGNYKEPPLSNSLLRKVLMLELELRGESHLASSLAISGASAPPWSKVIRSGTMKKAPALRLETLTEFDPRASVYRDGEWTRPE